MTAAHLDLDERSRAILKALIQVYVATGEPVASETLARRLHHSVSSATVRNVMARLEHLGFLEQPHTSAGRVPTDDGLRVFVEQLMGPRPLSPLETAAIESGLSERCGSCAEVMTSASQLLSLLTGTVGFALAPESSRTHIRHIEFIRLPFPRILAIVVSRSGLVTHRVVEIDEAITQEQLQTCAGIVNARFAGLDLRSIRNSVLAQMHVDKALFESLFERLIAATEQAFALEHEGSVFLEGASRLLDGLHAADLERMRALFRTFEEKSRLVKILTACLAEDGVRVHIGCEALDPDLRGVTVVTAGYGLNGEAGWGLGVVGPTRMEYPHVVAVVDQVAQRTQRLLTELNP
jgi:heat-inducible transcriptional repressor